MYPNTSTNHLQLFNDMYLADMYISIQADFIEEREQRLNAEYIQGVVKYAKKLPPIFSSNIKKMIKENRNNHVKLGDCINETFEWLYSYFGKVIYCDFIKSGKNIHEYFIGFLKDDPDEIVINDDLENLKSGDLIDYSDILRFKKYSNDTYGINMSSDVNHNYLRKNYVLFLFKHFFSGIIEDYAVEHFEQNPNSDC